MAAGRVTIHSRGSTRECSHALNLLLRRVRASTPIRRETIPVAEMRHRKILLVVVGLGVGGTETHVLELATRLDRERFDLVVCSLKSGGVVADELRARGIRVVSLGGICKIDIRVLFRLRKFLKLERPEVIQAFLFWANVSARVACLFMRSVKVISSYHDEVVPEGWLTRMIDRLTVEWSDRIVCCSEAVRRSVRTKIGGVEKKFVTIPFGVESRRFADAIPATRVELGLNDDLPIIGTVCRLMEPKKGLSILLQAIAHLERVAGKPVCHVLIVGEGLAKGKLRTLSEDLGIDARVHFTGQRLDVPRLISRMDIFVLPSLYEGFGIAILEAMAAGKPVVATTVGGIPEFVVSGESGLLVEPGNVVSLAQAIKQLLDQPEYAKSMGKAGQEQAKKGYSIERVVKRHEDLYELCLAESS